MRPNHHQRFILRSDLVRENLIAHLRKLRIDPDHPILVELSPYRKTRSNQQNRYLWGVVYALIAETTGYETEELHEMFKRNFLGEQITAVELPGLTCGEYVTTTKLTTMDFAEYIEKIRRWASIHLEMNIPDPNQWLEEAT